MHGLAQFYWVQEIKRQVVKTYDEITDICQNLFGQILYFSSLSFIYAFNFISSHIFIENIFLTMLLD